MSKAEWQWAATISWPTMRGHLFDQLTGVIKCCFACSRKWPWLPVSAFHTDASPAHTLWNPLGWVSPVKLSNHVLRHVGVTAWDRTTLYSGFKQISLSNDFNGVLKLTFDCSQHNNGPITLTLCYCRRVNIGPKTGQFCAKCYGGTLCPHASSYVLRISVFCIASI